jgi:hypothetical protein
MQAFHALCRSGARRFFPRKKNKAAANARFAAALLWFRILFVYFT